MKIWPVIQFFQIQENGLEGELNYLLMSFLLLFLVSGNPGFCQEVPLVWQSKDNAHRLILLSSNPYMQSGRALLYGRYESGNQHFNFVQEVRTIPCKREERKCFTFLLDQVELFGEEEISALTIHKQEAGVKKRYVNLGEVRLSYILEDNSSGGKKGYLEMRCLIPGSCYLRKKIKLQYSE